MSSSRPKIVGSDSGPELPYPYRMEGPVISGFGRGSKELGIPTANLPVDEKTTPWIADSVSGVYFGWAVLEGEGGDKDSKEAKEGEAAQAATSVPPSSSSGELYPMVMSIGYNPFYQNTSRTAEVHILHQFRRDFYGAHLRLALLGFIRAERGDYSGVDELVADIKFDCDVARASLARAGWTPKGVAVSGESGSQGTLDVPWLLSGETKQ